jgi:hypothetical protein
MVKMKHIVTLSDHNYLIYGLTLYQSIEEQTENYTLHYLCTSQEAYDKLVSLNLPNIKPYNIKDLHKDKDFVQLKNNHKSNNRNGYGSNDHFHWALASFFSYYLMDSYDLPHVLYIDSDIVFYHPVERVLDAVSDKSIGLITHKHNKKDAATGYFNVGIVYFKNDEVGKSCLKFWRDCCINPSNEYSEVYGTCGDQKYLELFDKLFDKNKIKILCHEVGNIAPWNLHMCKLLGNNEMLWYDHEGFVLEPKTSKVQSIVFMHFSHFTPDFENQSFKLDRDGEWGPIASYDNVIELYREYFIRCFHIKRKYRL